MNQKINNLPDLKERQMALDTNSSFVVVAPAGSGKTQLLIKRYLKLLAKARAIDTVLCLTFTNKATEEMRERVLGAINNCRNSEGKDENEKELFELAKKVFENHNIQKAQLLNPHSFQIYTFHSFCSSLLRKFPSKESVSDFETINEIEAELLYQKTAEIVISKAVLGEDKELSDAVARRLASLDEKIDNLKRQIATLIRNRDRLLNIRQYDKNRLDELITDLLKGLAKNFITFFRNNRDNFEKLFEYFDKETKDNLLDLENLQKEKLNYLSTLASDILTGNGTPRKSAFRKDLNLPQDLKDFIREMPLPAANELDLLRKIAPKSNSFFEEENLLDVLKILDTSKKVFDSLLSEVKKDFIEIELSALKSLEWINGLPSQILEKMQFKIDHILVDEAQDLSDIEYKIISKLTEGWTEADGRTIFFVGDPKQSIYRFRKSNVALFSLLLKNGLVREDEKPYPLNKIELKINFRSTPKIIKFVNTTFDNYFQDDDFLDDIPYSSFYHQSDTFEGSPISMNKIEEEKDVSLFVAEDLSELHRSFVHTLSSVVENLSEKETVGILFKRRQQFASYHKVLKEYGIDVDTVEGEHLANSYAVKHLFNLLKATLSPEEDLYWLSIAGSPFINCSPEEIYKISNQNHKSWFEKIINSELIDPKVRKVLKLMTEDFYFEKGGVNFIRHFEEISGYELIKKIYNYEGVEECREFFRILSSLSHLPPKELISEMESFIKNTFSPSNPFIPKNKVQAMTIHKAKGLEFDYVFVLGLDEKPGNGGRSDGPPPLLIERLQFDEENRFFPFLSAPFDKSEITYQILSDLDKKRQQSEYKRIYYVALTRARKKLFLFGKVKKGNNSKSILERICASHTLTPPSSQISLQGTQIKPEKAKELPLSFVVPQFEPQKIPFTIKRASEEANFSRETNLCYRTSEETLKIARAKGIAIHKILENFAKGKTNLNTNYVKKLLKNTNIKPEEDFASDILNEAKEVWQLSDFENLRKSKKLVPEYSLEMADNDKINVGRIDLMLIGNNEAVAIDYKTSNLSGDLEVWLEKEKEKYKPQMEIYKMMISEKEKIAIDKVKCFIIFTLPKVIKEIQ